MLQLFSVEKTKLYVHKVNVFIDRERQYFPCLLYCTCEGLNSFPSSETSKEICPMVRNSLYLPENDVNPQKASGGGGEGGPKCIF